MFSEKLIQFREANSPIYLWDSEKIDGLLRICMEEMQKNYSTGDGLKITTALGDRVNATVNLIFKSQLGIDFFKNLFIEQKGVENANHFFTTVDKK